ncbi:MAG: hypothetical protein LUE10_00310, partial [Alistipes sp.]|nr:hypothetical protein [Alistipes sp.]
AEFNGWKVPDVLLSGNFALIEGWREEQAWERTRRLRPDLIDGLEPAGAGNREEGPTGGAPRKSGGGKKV